MIALCHFYSLALWKRDELVSTKGGWVVGWVWYCSRLPLDQINPHAISLLCQPHLFPFTPVYACWRLKCESTVQQRRKVRKLQMSKWCFFSDGDDFVCPPSFHSDQKTIGKSNLHVLLTLSADSLSFLTSTLREIRSGSIPASQAPYFFTF